MKTQDAIYKATTFSQLYEIAKNVEPELSYLGTRSIRSKDDGVCEGTALLNDLACRTQKILYKDPIVTRKTTNPYPEFSTLVDRDCFSINNKEESCLLLLRSRINKIYSESDKQVKDSNIIVRIFSRINELFRINFIETRVHPHRFGIRLLWEVASPDYPIAVNPYNGISINPPPPPWEELAISERGSV